MIKTVIKIDGMTCQMCEAHINDAIRNTFTVKSVKSSHKKDTCEIISENVLDYDDIKEAIEHTGYRVTDVSAETYIKKGLFSK